MIRSILSSVIFCLSISPLLAQDKPVSYSVDRYSVIWKNSMFARKAAAKKENTGNTRWTLAGIFSYEGKKRAVILNEATGEVEQIQMEAANPSGLTLLEVVEDQETGTAGVKVDKQGKVFWITKQLPVKKKPETKPSSGGGIMAGQISAGDLHKTVASQ